MSYVKKVLTLKQRAALTLIAAMLVLSLAMMSLQYIVEIDSSYDLLFESNTLFIVIYIYVVARDSILHNTKLKYGLLLLIFNKFYDVITEIEVYDRIADQHEFIDTFLEDGLLQLSFLIIAVGLTEMLRDIKDNAAKDELTGLYNRKKLNTIKFDVFDLIYIDLDGLKIVNDSKGHHVGDLMIIRFAQALNSSIGELGQAFRVGGDEFIVTVPVNQGEAFIANLKDTLSGEQIGFSYGIETATTQESLQDALVKTDKAMYEMKNSQRNS